MLEKDQGVLFYCYVCEVNMVKVDNKNYKCPKCGDNAEFDFDKIDLPKLIKDSGGWLDTDEVRSSNQKVKT